MYKRVLLKLSGEALSSKEHAFDPVVLHNLALELKEVHECGVDLAIVVGGGNFIRGKVCEQMGLERTQADNMGMLATVINALAVQNALEQVGVPTRVQTAIEMNKVAEPYILRRCLRHLDKGRVVIFGAGTGNPYFSTDTTAALRASEIKADVILMAKNGVDGVYDADPKLVPTATRFDSLTYLDLINKDLHVMDVTATSMCMDNDIDLVVFNMNEAGNILKAVKGEVDGTTISKKGIIMQQILDHTSEKMDKALESLRHHLAQIRTGRANPQLLEGVEVDYYGSPTPLNQMYSITVVEGRQLCIKPFDKSMLKDIEHAVNAANLGLTPQNDGECVRLNVPQLTGDTRKELAKDASKVGEEAKVAIRNLRRDANDAVKKNKEFTEDMVKQATEKVQKLTDKYTKEVDTIVAEKQNDIMSI